MGFKTIRSTVTGKTSNDGREEFPAVSDIFDFLKCIVYQAHRDFFDGLHFRELNSAWSRRIDRYHGQTWKKKEYWGPIQISSLPLEPPSWGATTHFTKDLVGRESRIRFCYCLLRESFMVQWIHGDPCSFIFMLSPQHLAQHLNIYLEVIRFVIPFFSHVCFQWLATGRRQSAFLKHDNHFSSFSCELPRSFDCSFKIYISIFCALQIQTKSLEHFILLFSLPSYEWLFFWSSANITGKAWGSI